MAAVMAPAEGKNGKSGSFFPKTGAAAGAYLAWDFHIIKFDFFSELLRAHAAHYAACALKVSEATDNFMIGKSQISPQPSQLYLGLGFVLSAHVNNECTLL